MRREPLEIERLIRADQRHTASEHRRVSIGEHEQFRANMQQPDPIDNELETDFGCHPAAASNERGAS